MKIHPSAFIVLLCDALAQIGMVDRADQGIFGEELVINDRAPLAVGGLGGVCDDGLDMHLYTLVATPFVAELLRTQPSDPSVGQHGSMINAAFLVGWALGGAFFGRVGDLLGRSRTLILTILT